MSDSDRSRRPRRRRPHRQPRRRTSPSPAPALRTTPAQYVPLIGPVYWASAPTPRGQCALRVGAVVGAVRITGEYYQPVESCDRRSVRWLEITCRCGHAAPKLTRANNVTTNGARLACRDCVRARGGYKTGAAHRNWRGVGAVSGAHLAALRVDARKRGLAVTITPAEIAAQFEAQGYRCAYSGVPLVSASARGARTASIERLDSRDGYVPGNVVLVHKHLNTMRRTLTLARLVAIAEAVVAHQGAARRGPVDPQLDPDPTPPPPPVMLARLGCRRDRQGKSRAYGRYRCGRCRRTFEARVENVASGNTRSCGCWGNAIRGQTSRRDAARHGPIRATYLTAVARNATARGRAFGITPEVVRDLYRQQRGRCALTGWPLRVRGGRGLASLDRLDPSIGYVAGNLRLTTPEVNLFRHKRTDAEFRTWCAKIAQHLGRHWSDRTTPPTAAQLATWAAVAVVGATGK